jgi:translation elongation factor EF-1beta
MEGLTWGEAQEKVPLAFGIFKLQVRCVRWVSASQKCTTAFCRILAVSCALYTVDYTANSPSRFCHWCQLMCTVVDDLVPSTDMIIEPIEGGMSDLVQSVDIYSFNKV